MKIKLDENLPNELTPLLADAGNDVHNVRDEQLTGETDSIVFKAACAEGRLLITQDLDFSDIQKFKPGSHPGIVLVRLRDPNRRKLIERMTQLLKDEDIKGWAGCFVVVGDIRLRVLRP